jgi:hypothetical protein
VLPVKAPVMMGNATWPVRPQLAKLLVVWLAVATPAAACAARQAAELA